MKKLMVVTAGLLLSFWIVVPGYGGSLQTAGDAQATSPATSEPKIQAYDKDGNPMTPEEFEKAYKQMMRERSATSKSRLEARQSRWKKDGKQGAPQEPNTK